MLNLVKNKTDYFSPLDQFDIINPYIVEGISLFNGYSITVFLVVSFIFIFLNLANLLQKVHIFFKSIILSNLILLMLGITSSTNQRSKTRISYFMPIFLIILFCNYIGQIPIIKAVTAYISFPLYFSGILHIIVNFLAIFLFSFILFLGFFVPAGMPAAMSPILCVVEAISHIIKLFSLAIRLFANIFAGHVLLHILCQAAFQTLLVTTLILIGIAGVVSISFIIQVLELFICFLQTFIFLLLASIYVGELSHLTDMSQPATT
jgi:F-type H+-transporting ATPase subunit a